MFLTVLGSSGTYPAPGRPASGYLIEHGETRIWCDAGPGTFTALCDTIDSELVTAVFVSHQHPDHCLDLIAALHRWAYGVPHRQRVPVIAPASVFDRLGAFLDASAEHPLYTVFELDPVDEGQDRVLGDITVSFAVTDHSVPTLATRWEADGRALAYTSDTGPGGNWQRIVGDADLLVSEATFQGDRASDPASFHNHLTASEAGAIARAAGARRLMLTHIPPHLDVSVSLSEAELAFDRPVELAVPGTRHKV